MKMEAVERILASADRQLNIILCKSDDEIACELIPACDRFMKVNGFCECGADASFIHMHKDVCRECKNNTR